MKVMYIECAMGAAGDMLLSALLELCGDVPAMMERLNGTGIPGVVYHAEKSVKCGISGTHITVSVHGAVEGEHHHHHHGHEHHHHSGMRDIERIIQSLNVSDTVKADALAVYRLIAEAESHAHDCEIDRIHFHEVGTMDAVADVVGVCMLMEVLAPDKVYASAVHVGSGTVECAHGTLPVPAPAAAYILKDIPVYGGKIKGELCTPTGAALLKYFVSEFGEMPVMRVAEIGCGMGTKDFETANCVRIMLGETEDTIDRICELRCNLDDMTGEAVGFAMNKLFDAGALDVFTAPIGMKKNRPAVLLTCMCREEDREDMIRLLFKHTTTIGVREYLCSRYILDREMTTVQTNYGEIPAKKSSGWGVTRIKPEYSGLEKTALENDAALSDIKILN